MKSFIRFLILLTGTIFAIIFTVQNKGVTEINVFFYQGSVQVSLLVFVSLFIGALFAWLFNSIGNIGKYRKMKHLKKQLDVSEIEISNLRKLPIKDSD